MDDVSLRQDDSGKDATANQTEDNKNNETEREASVQECDPPKRDHLAEDTVEGHVVKSGANTGKAPEQAAGASVGNVEESQPVTDAIEVNGEEACKGEGTSQSADTGETEDSKVVNGEKKGEGEKEEDKNRKGQEVVKNGKIEKEDEDKEKGGENIARKKGKGEKIGEGKTEAKIKGDKGKDRKVKAGKGAGEKGEAGKGEKAKERGHMKPAEHKPRFILPVCPALRAQETRDSPSPHSLTHHALSHTSTDTHTQRLTKDWRMAVSMRRMNGSWRGMALALVLCTLLLHNEVHCQDSIDTPYTSDAKDSPGAAPTDAPGAAPTDAPGAAPTDAPGAAPTDAPGAAPTYTPGAAPTDALGAAPTDATGVAAHADDTQGTDATIEPQAPVDDKATTVTNSTADNTSGTSTPVPDQDTTFTPVPDQDTAFTSMVPDHDPLATGDTSGTTAGPGVDTQGTEATDDPGAPVVHQAPVFVLPTVECVDKEAVKDKDTVKVELSSETSCSVTKRIMEDSAWCTGDCNLKLFQEENSNTLVLTRSNGGVKDLSESLNSQDIKGQLGVVNAAPQWGKHSSTVLVSLLISGLLLAAALIGGYCLKKHCRHNAKGMRLAEDAYPVDEENQGNTLVSVAPLNTLETREKPANGDSQEAAKTQPPPTNGHSTANLADTEL